MYEVATAADKSNACPRAGSIRAAAPEPPSKPIAAPQKSPSTAFNRDRSDQSGLSAVPAPLVCYNFSAANRFQSIASGCVVRLTFRARAFEGWASGFHYFRFARSKFSVHDPPLFARGITKEETKVDFVPRFTKQTSLFSQEALKGRTNAMLNTML